MGGDMKGEFYKAPGRLRHELKKEFEPLVEGRLLSEGPDDIVRNNWHKLLQKFEEVIQREKNRIQQRLNEIQRELGDIKLEDIEKSLEKIRKKRRELEEELRASKEVLEIVLGSVMKLQKEAEIIRIKQMEIERELKRLEMLEKDLKKKHIRGGSVSEFKRIFQEILMSKVEKLRRNERGLREELGRFEEDLRNIESAFRFIKRYRIVIIGENEDLIRGFIGEDKYRLVEPYLKKLKERAKLGIEEEELESKKDDLLEKLHRKEFLLEQLKRIELIEARSDEDKIRAFIKDIIREMRREKEISYEPKLYDQEDLFRYGEDVLS